MNYKVNSGYTAEKVGEPKHGGVIMCPWCIRPIHGWRPGLMKCPHCGNQIRVKKSGGAEKR